MTLCFVSIGSNIEREKNIRTALHALHEHFGALLISSVYETESVGFQGDPFYNLVAGFSSPQTPPAIAAVLDHIEHLHGRIRGGQRFGPRVLDIDLLLVGDTQDTTLRLPRPEIEKYAFVLQPLAEIAPNLILPGTQKMFIELWRAMPSPPTARKITLGAG